jgi:PIN domain nuclease of toxin-antitoxin system
MRVLLDTHIAIWAINDDARLSVPARKIINNANMAILISAVSIWEISIKHALGQKRKDAVPFTGDAALKIFRQFDFEMIDIVPEHAALVDELELIHSDPFDRMLIAQARYEGLQLLTHDKMLAAYGDFVIAA